MFRNSNSKIYIFVNEAGTITKRFSGTSAVMNAWNLALWTYQPASNTVTLDVNGDGTITTQLDVLSVPYTTDSNLYLGNIPNVNTKRFEGYFGQYVTWSTNLNSTQRSNFWLHGTIV